MWIFLSDRMAIMIRSFPLRFIALSDVLAQTTALSHSFCHINRLKLNTICKHMSDTMQIPAERRSHSEMNGMYIPT